MSVRVGCLSISIIIFCAHMSSLGCRYIKMAQQRMIASVCLLLLAGSAMAVSPPPSPHLIKTHVPVNIHTRAGHRSVRLSIASPFRRTRLHVLTHDSCPCRWRCPVDPISPTAKMWSTMTTRAPPPWEATPCH